MKTLLETIDLRKTYTVGKIEVEALRGVSLRIQEGELASIMGRPVVANPRSCTSWER